jgi:hypothetical protein
VLMWHGKALGGMDDYVGAHAAHIMAWTVAAQHGAKQMRSSRRGPAGCNGHVGQGPMDGGDATRQHGDERANELPDGGAASARAGVKAAGDGSCEHEGAMKYGCDTKTEEKRDRWLASVTVKFWLRQRDDGGGYRR